MCAACCARRVPQSPAPAPAASRMAAVFRLSLGIGDIDSYAMLFYGHYPRYCERAATASLPAQSGAFFQLTSADLIKYSKSVGWNDVVDIRSTAVPPTKDASSDERAFLHEWICEGKTVHTCLATYRLVTAEPPTHDAPPTIAPAAAAPAFRRVLQRSRRARHAEQRLVDKALPRLSCGAWPAERGGGVRPAARDVGGSGTIPASGRHQRSGACEDKQESISGCLDSGLRAREHRLATDL